MSARPVIKMSTMHANMQETAIAVAQVMTQLLFTLMNTIFRLFILSMNDEIDWQLSILLIGGFGEFHHRGRDCLFHQEEV